nr:spindle pole body component alp4 [Quercus suber]
MASIPSVRSTSHPERRTSASVRQKSRPTSASTPTTDQENRSTGRKATTTTTTETRTDLLSREERLIRRTRSPLKPAEPRPANVRRNPAVVVDRSHEVEKDRARKPNDHVSPPAWSPRATLLPPTTSAPLACRISIPPLSKDASIPFRPPTLGSLSLYKQERAIIDDLLFVLMGFEGQYVCYTDGYNPFEEKSRLIGPQFKIAHGLDPSLRDLASGMLKTATYYAAVEVFVEVMGKEESGTINHALCAAMRKLLKDYLILIAQLEHQVLTNPVFTLHQLNLHLKATSNTMSQLYHLAQEVLRENSMLGNLDDDIDQSDDMENILEALREGRDANIPGKKTCRGGAVLRLITRQLQSSSGDPAASHLLSNLLQETSKPYMRMLNEWLHHGNVRDPHNEFLIKEQKSIRREGLQQDYTDEYWEKRYTIRPESVPPQLEAVKERVLLAGKYLNVVRECGGVSSLDLVQGTDVPHTFGDSRFLENVSGAYAFANRSLMALLLTTHTLPARLRSLKHYFFLDRSDFFSYFLELSASELRKPAKNVNTSKIQSLLDIVLRQGGSVAAEDPFKEDVKVTMSDTGLTGWLMRVVNVQGMDADASSLSAAYTPAAGSVNGKDEKDITGYEALTLDYAVPFPLSLIISRNTLTRYQLLFRYVLSLRHLEAMLTNSWTEHTKARAWHHKLKSNQLSKMTPEAKKHAARIENWKRRAWTLRSRMLCFVQQLLYFSTSEVIEPNWTSFMSRVSHSEEPSLSSSTQVSSTAYSGSEDSNDAATAGVKRTVDELMQDHVDFLATCLKECMLTNSKLLRVTTISLSHDIFRG